MIGESELILNPRGSVYHLDLRPEEIADTIFTVGDPSRVREVSKYFDSIEFSIQRREFVTHTGHFRGKRFSVVSTGIGTDNIDIVLNELDALANIDLERRELKEEIRKLKIIRIGTSGSLREEIPVDSFVASEFAFGMDNLLDFYEMNYSGEERKLLDAFMNHVEQNQIGFIPYLASSDPQLLSIFKSQIATGITVTCPGFYGPQGRRLRAPLAYPNLIELLGSFRYKNFQLTNFEMETAGIYGLSRVLGHDAISLSAIIANRVTNDFTKDHESLVDKMIQFALERIAED